MRNSNIPEDRELPTTEKLLKSTVIAAIGAMVLLITVVMPAEYGIDPTGVGNMLGLKRMGEIKTSLAAEIEADEAAHAAEQVATAEEDHAHGADTHTHDEKAAPVAMVEAAEEDHAHGADTHTHDEEAAPVAMVEAAEEDHAHGADTHTHDEVAIDNMTITLASNEGKEVKVTLQKGKTVSYNWVSSSGDVTFDAHGDSSALNIDYHSYKKGQSSSDEGTIIAEFDGKHGWFWRNRSASPVTIQLQVTGEYTDIVELN